MVSCRICLEGLKKPVSLPCGHIFCSGCIVKTVQAVKPYSHLHPCPICRSIYNIAPINFSIVPPNLRPFVTPSVRKLYIDHQPPRESEEDTLKVEPDTPTTEDAAHETPDAPSSSSESSSSEISRLRAENIALRNNCYMWRKRAEMHGTANLGLLNFARVVRDQASVLARERDELQLRVHTLKRKIEDVGSYPELTPLGSFLQETPESHALHGDSVSPVPGSLLFAPHPIPLFSGDHETMPPSFRHETSAPSSSQVSSTESPRKKTKIDDDRNRTNLKPSDERLSSVSAVGSVASKIAARQDDTLADAQQSELPGVTS